MNHIQLTGIIHNLHSSHSIKNIEYDQCVLLVSRPDTKVDSLTIKFKKYSNTYNEGDMVSLAGNLRSYSEKLADGRNKVDLYVFTYFDLPGSDAVNQFDIDGRICKIDPIRYTKNNQPNIHLILANNLIIEESHQKLNSYLPCIAWGKTALALSNLRVGDQIIIHGEFHSREYKKYLDNNEFETKTAHELLIKSFEVIK